MRNAVIFVLGVVLLACAPDFDDRPYLLEHARLVAVIADPPEARPREAVTLTPVVAGPGARNLQPTLRFCVEPTAPADPRPVAESCVAGHGLPLDESGESAVGTIPGDACARFGPDPASGELRPADPDATGGFYQPVVATGLPEPSVTRVRIQCPLPDVSADLARDFAEQYVPNRNPELLTLELLVDGVARPVESSIRAGRPNHLRVTWSGGSVEDYARIAPDGTAIERRTESLRVSWFTTSGLLGSSATGPEAATNPASSSNTFIPDSRNGQTDLWVVLQDSRGGSAAQHWRLRVDAFD
jgi:hypothetical protein